MEPHHLFGLVIVVVLIAIFVISKNRQSSSAVGMGWRHKLSEVTGIGKDPPDEAEIHRLVQEINSGVV